MQHQTRFSVACAHTDIQCRHTDVFDKRHPATLPPSTSSSDTVTHVLRLKGFNSAALQGKPFFVNSDPFFVFGDAMVLSVQCDTKLRIMHIGLSQHKAQATRAASVADLDAAVSTMRTHVQVRLLPIPSPVKSSESPAAAANTPPPRTSALWLHEYTFHAANTISFENFASLDALGAFQDDGCLFFDVCSVIVPAHSEIMVTVESQLEDAYSTALRSAAQMREDSSLLHTPQHRFVVARHWACHRLRDIVTRTLTPYVRNISGPDDLQLFRTFEAYPEDALELNDAVASAPVQRLSKGQRLPFGGHPTLYLRRRRPGLDVADGAHTMLIILKTFDATSLRLKHAGSVLVCGQSGAEDMWRRMAVCAFGASAPDMNGIEWFKEGCCQLMDPTHTRSGDVFIGVLRSRARKAWARIQPCVSNAASESEAIRRWIRMMLQTTLTRGDTVKELGGVKFARAPDLAITDWAVGACSDIDRASIYAQDLTALAASTLIRLLDTHLFRPEFVRSKPVTALVQSLNKMRVARAQCSARSADKVSSFISPLPAKDHTTTPDTPCIGRVCPCRFNGAHANKKMMLELQSAETRIITAEKMLDGPYRQASICSWELLRVGPDVAGAEEDTSWMDEPSAGTTQQQQHTGKSKCAKRKLHQRPKQPAVNVQVSADQYSSSNNPDDEDTNGSSSSGDLHNSSFDDDPSSPSHEENVSNNGNMSSASSVVASTACSTVTSTVSDVRASVASGADTSTASSASVSPVPSDTNTSVKASEPSGKTSNSSTPEGVARMLTRSPAATVDEMACLVVITSEALFTEMMSNKVVAVPRRFQHLLPCHRYPEDRVVVCHRFYGQWDSLVGPFRTVGTTQSRLLQHTEARAYPVQCRFVSDAASTIMHLVCSKWRWRARELLGSGGGTRVMGTRTLTKLRRAFATHGEPMMEPLPRLNTLPPVGRSHDSAVESTESNAERLAALELIFTCREQYAHYSDTIPQLLPSPYQF